MRMQYSLQMYLYAALIRGRLLFPLKPGSQYDAGASVVGENWCSRSQFSVGGVVEGVSEGGSLYEPRPWRSKISATSASNALRKR